MKRDIPGFLAACGWQGAERRPLAGDASARRYERLDRGGDRAVLMVSPAPDEVARFHNVGSWLRDHGFSAPEIYAIAPEQGLMLLEDLGDDLISHLLRVDPAREGDLYAAITDFLIALHRLPPPGFVAPLDGRALADLVRLAPEWYPVASPEAAREVPDLIAALSTTLDDLPPVLSLRDFHADNALWLPARAGTARLGLLDFQDAVAAHPAYDLVSALQDVRRAVSPEVEQREIARYVAARALDPDRFGAAYALLGAQRALRIMAVFARLCLAMGKAHYLDFMPRNHALLQHNLRHPALAPLSRAITAAFPPPDPALLQDLRSRCATRPTP